MLAIVNPLGQIQKSQDAKRESNLKQLQTALDAYYNDNNYYPQSLNSLATTSNNFYIKNIPDDPGSPSWVNYSYLTDGSGNSQWNILFAKLAFPSNSTFSCPLAGQNCIPSNYQNLGYNYCVVSGKVDCSLIPNLTLVPKIPAGTAQTPTVTTTSSPSPSPSPEPSYCYCKDATYWIDVTKDPNHQCQIVEPNPDPNVNSDRYCNYPCVGPCTP
jgi:type II secretory pathway pseudopilin PulG